VRAASSSPFADDHARAIISGANNPKPETQSVHTRIVHEPENVRTVVPCYPVTPNLNTREVKAPKIVQLDTSPVLEMLAQLERIVDELQTEIQIHGGFVAENVQHRIKKQAHALLALADNPPVRRLN
jgi:hypothetical protein